MLLEINSVSVSCPSLLDLDSGTFTLSSNGEVSQASFSCNDGYHLVGAAVLSCTTNGDWNGSIPFCGETKICISVKSVHIKNGSRD